MKLFFLFLSFVTLLNLSHESLAQNQDYFATYTTSYMYWLREEQGLMETHSLLDRSLGHFAMLPQIAIHKILNQPGNPWKLYAAHQFNREGLRRPATIKKVVTSKEGLTEDLYTDGHLFIFRDDINTGPHLIITFGADWDWEKLIGNITISYSQNDYFAAIEFATLFKEYGTIKNPYRGAAIHTGSSSNYQFQFLDNTQDFHFTWNDLILNSETKTLTYQLTQNYLEHQEDYQLLNIPTKQGVLLAGPPGTGKSFLAQILMSSILNGNLKDQATMVVVTARHLKNPSGLSTLFEAIKNLGTTCLFMEDIDLFGIKNRTTKSDYDSFNAEILLNELLNGIDGISENKNILIIGTTNKLENVDEALLRSERLGFHLYFALPSFEERVEFFNQFGKKKALWTPETTVEWLAARTENLSGADILEIISLAKRFAYNENSWSGDLLLLTKDHFLKAIQLVKNETTGNNQQTFAGLNTNKFHDKSDQYTRALKKLLRNTSVATKLERKK